MPKTNDFAGAAAFTLTETILLLLLEKGVLKADDVTEALEDCVAVHRNAAASDDSGQAHISTAQTLERLLLGRNWDCAGARCSDMDAVPNLDVVTASR